MVAGVVISAALHIAAHGGGGKGDRGVSAGADMSQRLGGGQDLGRGCHRVVGRTVGQVVWQPNDVVGVAVFWVRAIFWKLREIPPFRVLTKVVLSGVFKIHQHFGHCGKDQDVVVVAEKSFPL